MAKIANVTATLAIDIADFPPVCFSLPRIIGSAGVLSTLLPELSQEDHQALMSAGVIQTAASEMATDLG